MGHNPAFRISPMSASKDSRAATTTAPNLVRYQTGQAERLWTFIFFRQQYFGHLTF
jgi:hypothetical protein